MSYRAVFDGPTGVYKFPELTDALTRRAADVAGPLLHDLRPVKFISLSMVIGEGCLDRLVGRALVYQRRTLLTLFPDATVELRALLPTSFYQTSSIMWYCPEMAGRIADALNPSEVL